MENLKNIWAVYYQKSNEDSIHVDSFWDIESNAIYHCDKLNQKGEYRYQVGYVHCDMAEESADSIEFIEYTGAYPNLCRGRLKLRIFGEVYVFGSVGWDKIEEQEAADGIEHYPKFWCSGGSVYVNGPVERIKKGPWKRGFDCDCDIIEDDFGEGFVDKLLEVMNKNIPQGCCGGCI